MAAHLARAAALAALASALGYMALRFRGRGHEAQAERLALQEWETDGGNSLSPDPGPTSVAAPMPDDQTARVP